MRRDPSRHLLAVIARIGLAGTVVFLGLSSAYAAPLQQRSFVTRLLHQPALQSALETGAVVGALLMLAGISLVWWLVSRRSTLAWQALGLLLLCLNQILLPSGPTFLKMASVVSGLCPLVLMMYLHSFTRVHKVRLTGMPVYVVLGAVQVLLCVGIVASSSCFFIQASDFSVLSILLVLIVAGVHQLKECRPFYRMVAFSCMATLWAFNFNAVMLGNFLSTSRVSIESAVNGLSIAVAILLGLAFWTHHRAASRQSIATQWADLLNRQDHRVRTEVKHQTQTLNASLVAAQRTNHQQTRLMAYIGHDLRAPMASIVGYAKLLRNSGSSTHKKHIAAIEHGAAHQLVLIDELLDHARGELGLFTLHPVALNLRELLEDIHQHALSLVAKNNNVFILDLPDTFPHWVSVDGNRLSQVLLNLLSNAAKFTHEGTITLAITCSFEPPILTLMFDITDTGTGIPVEDQERVFGSFEQAQPTEGSLGLGLFIARSIVETMGGQLTLTSVPGAGSTFCFAIALVAVDAMLASYQAESADPDPVQDSIVSPMAAAVRKTSSASLDVLSLLAATGQWTEIREWIADTSLAQPECGEFIALIAVLFDELNFEGIRQLATADDIANAATQRSIRLL
jgi:signal transduction histidine kinase